MATAIDKLNAQIKKILEEYADDVTSNVEEAVEKVGKQGVNTLRSESRQKFNGTGTYAKGWTRQTNKSRVGSSVTIYNKIPGLPHLLENGHAKRGGGRVQGTEHIAPVAKEIAESFEEKIRESI